MADAKLEVKAGPVSFSGEGAPEWLSKQLDKVLEKLPALVAAAHGAGQEPGEADGGENAKGKAPSRKSTKQQKPLAAFLKDKNASTGNQQRKFLATAQWIHDGGAKRVATGDVTRALSDHSQGKLTNPAQCLINLKTRGFVVRENKQFYVTDDGRAELDK
jgi:hypothetical protein